MNASYIIDYENPDAGIGHSLGYLNSVVKLCLRHDVRFAYTPRQVHKSTSMDAKWLCKQVLKKLIGRKSAETHNIGAGIDTLFDPGEGEARREEVERLIRRGDVQRVHLPAPRVAGAADRWDDAAVYAELDGVIRAHADRRVAFVMAGGRTGDCEYAATRAWFRAKYLRARSRHPIRSLYEPGRINVAVHIRRGDLLPSRQFSSLAFRMLPDEWYERILAQLIETLGTRVAVHIFSEGYEGRYVNERGEASPWVGRSVFPRGVEVREHIDRAFETDFHHLLSADVLVGSRSGMSHLAAMLGEGIKLVPPMWHSYEGTNHVILVDPENGGFDEQAFGEAAARLGCPRP